MFKINDKSKIFVTFALLSLIIGMIWNFFTNNSGYSFLRAISSYLLAIWFLLFAIYLKKNE